ncbi:MAG TPA: AraC family transcriptional regulator [Cyclobacteriaceae bacterium]|nr:AraC family transcriptional regulator [Cyclobacteriaceae bacterium]
METVLLHIKNMVCPRCIYIVEKELRDLGISVHHIELRLASVSIPANISFEDIDERLTPYGLKLIKDKDEIQVENIKKKIDEYILSLESKKINIRLSAFIGGEMRQNYYKLSKLFSFFESMSIDRYYIDRKIERIKELLEDDELNISEIAQSLGYSSVHYLSNQFKNVTGITPTEHKNIFKTKLGCHD